MTGSEVIRLRLLGVPAVEGPGDDAAAVQSQPKRLALLAYLAVQGRFVRREALTEIFWPDSDPDRARRALSQATHTLRRALGRESIRNRGIEELGVSPHHVWIDVRAFEAAIAGERWEEAVELHRGELLHGLNGDQLTPEFSRWLDGERLRLQRAAAGAAKTLADAAFKDGDVAAAVSWARRAVTVRPTDECMFREYIALLDETGDAALALSEYESFRARLADEYELEPARETVRMVEMIRNRRPETGPVIRPVNGRATPDTDPDFAVAHGTGASTPASEQQGLAGPPLPRPKPSLRRQARLGLALLPLFLVAWLAWDLVRSAPDGLANTITVPNRIAVLYLDAVGPNADDVTYIARGLTKSITTYLHSYSSLLVVPTTAVDDFKGRSVPHDSLKLMLRAAMFMSGQVEMATDGSVTVTVELVDDDQKLIWRDDLTFGTPDLVAIEDSVITEITAQIARIGAIIERRSLRRGTSDDDAYIAVSRAIDLTEQSSEEASAGRLDLATSLLDAADSLFRAAAQADRSWPKPHIEMARVEMRRGFLCYLLPTCDHVGAFQSGLASADRALELAGDTAYRAEAFEARATLHWQLWMYGSGGDSDTTFLTLAKDDAHSAVALRPQSPRAYSLLSQIFADQGLYTESLTAALDAFDRDEFLTLEGQILDNTFRAAFNAQDDTLARRNCAALARVESMSFRSLECRLQLMAWTDQMEPDVNEAWVLVNSFRRQSKSAFERVELQTGMLVASVIAAAAETRPEMADSARRVIERLLVSRSLDASNDDPLLYAAGAYARLGNGQQARALLASYLASGIRARLHVRNMRWFDGLVILELNDGTAGGS